MLQSCYKKYFLTSVVKMRVNDPRKSLDEIQEACATLVDAGFEQKLIQLPGIEEPVNVLVTETRGKALWVLSGIHGEEPAGPCAISDPNSIDELKKLGDKSVPMVIVPVCNPSGYSNNWRYPDGPDTDHSVGDSDHLLMDKNRSHRRRLEPSSIYAGTFTSAMLDLSEERPPLVVFDHHEDDEFPGPEKGKGGSYYLFSQGRRGRNDPVAQAVRKYVNEKFGLKGNFNGKTDIGQEIRGGIVGRSRDGSIDELLAANSIMRNGNVMRGPGANHAIVVETDSRPSSGIPLEGRVAIHKSIMESYGTFWDIAKKSE